MRKTSKFLFATAMAVTVLALANPSPTVMAKSKGKKSKVVYTLKKGTLTISGKGEMPKKMTFKNNKKVKKVVIKNGVTSVSDKAFYKCKNLSKVTIGKSVKKIGIDSFNGTKIKKVTIPKKVKEIGQDAFNNCKQLENITLPGKYRLKKKEGDDANDTIMYGSTPDTVTFSTSIDLKTVTYVNSYAFAVSANDKNYTSKSGLIYTKDGKTLVRVPAETKELSIYEGCENFALQSILYGTYSDGDVIVACDKLEKIRIPASVKKINLESYKTGDYLDRFDETKDVVISGADLDAESIINLCNRTNITTWSNVAKQVPSVKVEDGMYISKEGVMLGYEGKAEKVVIPEGVNTIASYALNVNNTDGSKKVAKEIVMPDTVTTIEDNAFRAEKNVEQITWSKNLKTVGDSAFEGCSLITLDMPTTVTKWGSRVFACSNLEKITISSTIKEIPDGMFESCIFLEGAVIPDNIEVIGNSAFSQCDRFKTVTIGKNVKTIKANAFRYSGLKEVIIPANVEKVENGAFANQWPLEKAVIEGKTVFENGVFNSTSSVTLDYRAGAQYNKTSIKLRSVKKSKNKYLTTKTKWVKVKGVSGYEVKVATDKKFKKNTKTVKVTETKTDVTVKIKVKDVKKIKKVYVKVTPYTFVNGTKVYGIAQTDLMEIN